MIAHVVLFQPRADLPAAARDELDRALRHAIDAIPSIRRVTLGRRIRSGGAYEAVMTVDYGFLAIFEFDDDRGLREYLEHPAHHALGRLFYTTSAAALAYDFALAYDPADLLSR